jgi:hypothetical protein
MMPQNAVIWGYSGSGMAIGSPSNQLSFFAILQAPAAVLVGA